MGDTKVWTIVYLQPLNFSTTNLTQIITSAIPLDVRNLVKIFWANRHLSPELHIPSIRNLKSSFQSAGKLRGWSRITEYYFKMADGSHLGFSRKRNYSAVCWVTFMKFGRNIQSSNRKNGPMTKTDTGNKIKMAAAAILNLTQRPYLGHRLLRWFDEAVGHYGDRK